MDHYKALGLNRNASREEIKESFRKLAMQFHPDKHSHSPKSVRDGATLRFKQVSEAYEVLMDDRKRADYNIRSYNNNNNNNNKYGGRGRASGFNSYGHGYNNTNNNTQSGPHSGYGYGYGYGYYGRAANGDGLVSKFEIVLRFLTTRSFLLNFAFAGVLLGGMIIIDTSRDALWKMQNPGKSFEDAMDSIERAKADKDKM